MRQKNAPLWTANTNEAEDPPRQNQKSPAERPVTQQLNSLVFISFESGNIKSLQRVGEIGEKKDTRKSREP